MLKFISTQVLLILFVYTSNSQSIVDFLFLRQASTTELFASMQEKNWFLYDEDEQRKNDILVYTFKQTDDIQSMLGIQWIDYVHRPKHHNKNRLSFQVQNLELYEKYISEMHQLGFTLDLEKAFDNHIMFVYEKDNVKIEVISSQNKYLNDGMMYYNFAFYDAIEYDAVFLEENEKYAKITNSNPNIASINFFK